MYRSGTWRRQKIPVASIDTQTNRKEVSMPYRWVPASVFLEHRGVTVYHVYKDDDVEQGVRQYWFGVREDCSDSDDAFDVRLLPNRSGHDLCTDAGRRAIIREAIDIGTITQEGPVLPRQEQAQDLRHEAAPMASSMDATPTHTLRRIFDILYLDLGPTGDHYNPEKNWDADTLESVAALVRPLFKELFLPEEARGQASGAAD